VKILLAFLALLVLPTTSCSDNAQAQEPSATRDVAVLLVNHGSRSAGWREALLELERAVEPRLLANERVGEVRTAFMEYTEPSIATQLRALDQAGYQEVLIVPIFLTVSSHSFDDIPTIIGAKDDVLAREGLAHEGIECYTPKADVTVAPLLDFAKVMRGNLKHRIGQLTRDAANEGVVLVAYGSTPYEAEWAQFMEAMYTGVSEDFGIDALEYAWCGHIASYSPEPTAEAIERVLATKDTALVIPVLVAVDEDFQFDMILEASKRTYAGGAVRYVPDAILPDPAIEDWVVAITAELTR
jgi:hypothetical protein